MDFVKVSHLLGDKYTLTIYIFTKTKQTLGFGVCGISDIEASAIKDGYFYNENCTLEDLIELLELKVVEQGWKVEGDWLMYWERGRYHEFVDKRNIENIYLRLDKEE